MPLYTASFSYRKWANFVSLVTTAIILLLACSRTTPSSVKCAISKPRLPCGKPPPGADSKIFPAPLLALATSGSLNGSRFPAANGELWEVAAVPLRWAGVLADLTGVGFAIIFRPAPCAVLGLGGGVCEDCCPAQLGGTPQISASAAKSKSLVA